MSRRAAAEGLICRNGAPTHPGVWGGGMSRDGAFSRAQQTKNWCVGFSFPPPAYAGIHPTLYLFGFRAALQATSRELQGPPGPRGPGAS